MTGTSGKTAMQPPPAPSIQLKRSSLGDSDNNVGKKAVKNEDIEQGTKNSGGDQWSPESQSNSTEVSSTTTCTNLDKRSEVCSKNSNVDICRSFEYKIRGITYPSPSIVEDLLDDGSSDSSTETMHGQELETAIKYDTAFPDPRHRIVHRTVEVLCCNILENYYKATRTTRMASLDGSIPQKIMTINFYKHLHKNQSRLDVHVTRIAKDEATPEAAWSCWSERSQLKNQIESYLGQGNTTGSLAMEPLTINWSDILPILRSGKTQLQKILRRNFSAGSPTTTEIWQDKWSPLNLTMPFELFIHCVTRRLAAAKPELERHRQRLLWKWYIQYMGVVAESNQEFILAVVSVFGTCIWRYSSKILEIFQLRDMLKVPCRVPGSIRSCIQASDDDLVLPRSNKLLEAELRIEAESHSSTIALISESHSLVSKYRLTLKEFLIVAAESLKSFHGSSYTASTQEISDWYKNLEQSNDFVQLLEQALQTLMAENKTFASFSGVKQITSAEYNQFKKLLEPELNNRKRKSGIFDVQQLTLQMTMETELSDLQLSLSLNTEIPSPQGWSPINSMFPYEAFCRIVYLQLNRKGEKFQLCTDALRVRYVELMSSYYANNRIHLLLAVFGAIGPDFDNCPLRILHILQTTGLIRQILGLPRYETSNTHAILKPFDQNYRQKKRKQATTTAILSPRPPQSADPAPKRLAISVAVQADRTQNVSSATPIVSSVAPIVSSTTPIVSSATPIVSNSSISNPASSSNGRTLMECITILDNLAPRIQNTAVAETEKLRGWKTATEDALNNFNLPPLSNTGALASLEQFMKHCEAQVSYKNPQFMEGMLAGISVAVKSWQEQKKRAAANCSMFDPSYDVFAGDSMWGAGLQSAAGQPSQNLVGRSLCDPFALTQPTQHPTPQYQYQGTADTGYQYPPIQSTQNYLLQGGSYQYMVVQMPMQHPPYNPQTGSTLPPIPPPPPPPPVAYAPLYSAPQTMSQHPSNVLRGAQPPQPTTSPILPPLPPGPAP